MLATISKRRIPQKWAQSLRWSSVEWSWKGGEILLSRTLCRVRGMKRPKAAKEGGDESLSYEVDVSENMQSQGECDCIHALSVGGGGGAEEAPRKRSCCSNLWREQRKIYSWKKGEKGVVTQL